MRRAHAVTEEQDDVARARAAGPDGPGPGLDLQARLGRRAVGRRGPDDQRACRAAAEATRQEIGGARRRAFLGARHRCATVHSTPSTHTRRPDGRRPVGPGRLDADVDELPGGQDAAIRRHDADCGGGPGQGRRDECEEQGERRGAWPSMIAGPPAAPILSGMKKVLVAILLAPALLTAQGRAKNVVLFLADAGGIPTITAASLHATGGVARPVRPEDAEHRPVGHVDGVADRHRLGGRHDGHRHRAEDPQRRHLAVGRHGARQDRWRAAQDHPRVRRAARPVDRVRDQRLDDRRHPGGAVRARERPRAERGHLPAGVRPPLRRRRGRHDRAGTRGHHQVAGCCRHRPRHDRDAHEAAHPCRAVGQCRPTPDAPS